MHSTFRKHNGKSQTKVAKSLKAKNYSSVPTGSRDIYNLKIYFDAIPVLELIIKHVKTKED